MSWIDRVNNTNDPGKLDNVGVESNGINRTAVAALLICTNQGNIMACSPPLVKSLANSMANCLPLIGLD